MEFITNRTQHNVDTLTRLRRKGWQNLSATERAEYLGNAALGAYNYTDLNRVESAVASISSTKNLGLVTKTNWSAWDAPTQSDMERYLGNVKTIHELCKNDGILIPESVIPAGESVIFEGVNIATITPGQILIVTIDGIRYERVYDDYSGSGGFTLHFNLGAWNDSKPFEIRITKSQTKVINGDTGQNHTVSMLSYECPVNIANLTLPDSMQHLTYEVANDIEAILEYALTGAVSVQMTLADMNEKTLKTLDGYTLAVIGT
jgi:hypothetical protein